MNAIVFVKTLVFFMTGLLIAGFGFLFVKIADKQAQSKLKNSEIVAVQSNETALPSTTDTPLNGSVAFGTVDKNTEHVSQYGVDNNSRGAAIKQVAVDVVLSDTETVQHMSGCGQFLCLTTQGHSHGARLLVFSPEQGVFIHTRFFKETAPDNN